MSSTSPSASGTGPAPTDPVALQDDIDEARQILVQTIDELHERLDVKAQARQRLEEAGGRVREVVAGARPWQVAAVAATAWAVIHRWRRRRRTRRAPQPAGAATVSS